MSIQSITCLFLTVTPLLTLYATDKIVNLFFMNVLKWQNFTPWRQIVNFTCCLIQEGVVLSLIDQRVTKRYFPACQTFGRKLDLVCLLGYLLYKIPQIDESVLDPSDIPVGPNRDLLELWGKLSEQSKVKYSCYYNKKYPERYDLSNQFKAWITAHQIQLKELDLAECDLNVFPPILLLLTQLHTLSLKKNSFTKFPSEVFQFQKLECLDLSDNQISEIPKDLLPSTQLSYLFLQRNRLESLPDTLLKWPSKCEINVNFNQINLETNKKLQQQLKAIRTANSEQGPTILSRKMAS